MPSGFDDWEFHGFRGLKKRNRIALIVSTEAINAMRWFPTDKDLSYNDVVHWVYDALYELNLECDVLFAQEKDWSGYDLLIFPELYCAHRALVQRVREFVEQGGTVFATFRSFFADERCKIFHDKQPHGLTDVFGMTYNQYTRPVNVTVKGAEASYWMELLKPESAEAAANYEHKYWGQYAAVTRNQFGKGKAWYLGAMLPPEALKKYLLQSVKDAGIVPEASLHWPIIVRSAVTQEKSIVRFLFNYSSEKADVACQWKAKDLLTGREYQAGETISLDDWGVCILEEN